MPLKDKIVKIIQENFIECCALIYTVFYAFVFISFVITEKTEPGETYGLTKDFIIVEKLDCKNYIVYHSGTKLMYRIVWNKYMIQLWDYDAEGHPIAKLYQEGDVYGK